MLEGVVGGIEVVHDQCVFLVNNAILMCWVWQMRREFLVCPTYWRPQEEQVIRYTRFLDSQNLMSFCFIKMYVKYCGCVT
jgi:hypothetical protein